MLGLSLRPPPPARIVILQRPRHGQRHVANMDALVLALRGVAARFGIGVDVRWPGNDTPFREQVRWMRSAALVVAPHGAALSSVVYLPLGRAVVEVFPPRMQYSLYSRIAWATGHRYAAVVARQQRGPGVEAPMDPWGNFTHLACFEVWNCILDSKKAPVVAPVAEVVTAATGLLESVIRIPKRARASR